MPYILIFSLSSFFMYLSGVEKINNKYKWSRYTCMILSVLTISIFAGVRSDTVGTDMQLYGNNVFFDSAKYSDFLTYYKNTHGWFKVEPIYMFLNFVSSRIVKSPAFFYFLLSLIINTCVYASIFKFKEKLNTTYAWISYLFIYYGYTFNLLRQSLAIGFILLAFAFLYEKKYKWTGLFTLIAWGSHFSSIPMSILILCLYFGLKKIRNKMKALVILIVLLIILVITINPIVGFLIKSNLLSDKYAMYLTNFLGLGFSFKSLLLKVPVIGIFVYTYKHLDKDVEDYFFFLFIFIFDFIFYQLRIINVTFSRMSLYMYIFQVLSVPYLINFIHSNIPLNFSLPKIRKTYRIMLNDRLITQLYILYLVVVWFYQVVGVGINDIYPYTSDILNIR